MFRKIVYRIQIDANVTPVVNQLKSQPVALRDRLKQALDEMEMDDVIAKVDQPTVWVNSVVVVEKPDSKKLRICLDPRPLNEAIQREHYTLLISGSHFNSTGGVEITPLRRVKRNGVKSTAKVELKLLYFGMHLNFYSTRSKFDSTKGVKITLPEE